MNFGFRFAWVDGPTPDGGEVMLWDRPGYIVCLLSRPAFEDDPSAFMDALERHCAANAAAHGWALGLAV